MIGLISVTFSKLWFNGLVGCLTEFISSLRFYVYSIESSSYLFQFLQAMSLTVISLIKSYEIAWL